ncbi:MAG: ABC transporter ATP-binding protein [Negativibacillus sp.]|nr:ABC transporter ATP-binding protein [Negativibacillus sp.]
MMVLQVKEIHKQYPQFLLDKINFELPEGAIMGLIGENGAGKSTTMRIILGMAQADSGSVSIFGHEGVTEQDRAQIGVVFDELPFNQTLFVSHLGKVMQGIYPNWDQQAYEEYLARFRLPGKKELKDFSRGMKMKLSLAVAMSHHARLLILDEPTSGLDPVVRAEILDLFLEFISDGKRSILVSSHMTGDLERIADYITLIHQGRVMLSKNKDELIYGYGIARADRQTLAAVDSSLVEAIQDGPYGSQALINDRVRFEREYPDILLDRLNLDEMMVMLCRNEAHRQ